MFRGSDDDCARFRRFQSTLSQAGVAVKNQFRLRHADHTWRFVESTEVNRLADPSIRGIIINYRDVTESRRAEEALRLGEERFRQLTEQATDIIYNCDLRGYFTFVNRTAVKLLKYVRRTPRATLQHADSAGLSERVPNSTKPRNDYSSPRT